MLPYSKCKLCVLCALVNWQEDTRAEKCQIQQLKGVMHVWVQVKGNSAKHQLKYAGEMYDLQAAKAARKRSVASSHKTD